MKKRGIGGGREVTISFRGKVIKMASQRKNEIDLTIYTESFRTFPVNKLDNYSFVVSSSIP